MQKTDSFIQAQQLRHLFNKAMSEQGLSLSQQEFRQIYEASSNKELRDYMIKQIISGMSDMAISSQRLLCTLKLIELLTLNGDN
jgi:hypothetical protein